MWILNLFSNNVKSFFSSEKIFHTESLFALTKVLTIVSNQFNLQTFSSPALSVDSVDMPFF